MTGGRVQLAVTVIGRDRPGIIADTTRLLAGLGANLEDSTMSILRGHFAMVLLAAADVTAAEAEAALAPLAADGSLQVSVRQVPEEAPAVALGATYLVSVHGADRPGIVSAVTAVVAEAGGNVTDLSTRLSGELYVLLAEVDLPAVGRPRAARPRPGRHRHRARRRGVDAGARPRRPLMSTGGAVPSSRARREHRGPARVAELAYAGALKALAERRAGSTPAPGTPVVGPRAGTGTRPLSLGWARNSSRDPPRAPLWRDVMESRNPVFNNSKAFSRKGYATFNDAPTATAGQLEDMYAAPAATGVDTGRMTIDDVVVKTGLMFAVLLPAARASAGLLNNPLLTFGGAIAGLVLGLMVSFKQSTNPALILSYAAAEGLFLGGISQVFEERWPGIVATAVLATLCVFASALVAYKSGKVRATPEVQAHRADRDGRLPGLLPGQHGRDAVRRRRRPSGCRWVVSASRSACSPSASRPRC